MVQIKKQACFMCCQLTILICYYYLLGTVQASRGPVRQRPIRDKCHAFCQDQKGLRGGGSEIHALGRQVGSGDVSKAPPRPGQANRDDAADYASCLAL